MTAADLLPALVVLGVLLIILAVVLGVALITRDWPMPPVRDSELPSTVTSPPEPAVELGDPWPRHSAPKARIWKDDPEHAPWVNTVPSGPMPLDEASSPWSQALDTMNAKERKP